MRIYWTVLCLTPCLTAQATWIVNAAGGPGVHFTNLPSAVAAAASGDTILVHAGPFGEGATSFVTNKGLTILGVGGAVPISTSFNNPIRIDGVPAGEAFRMVGFERISDGALHFLIQNCVGPVHLERIRAREFDTIFPTVPSISIGQSASVTLREVGNFGTPAVNAAGSVVQLIDCQLGVSHIGIGGGPAVYGLGSTIEIVRPRFDAGPGTGYSISSLVSNFRITGDATSYIRNPTGPVFSATGYTFVYDPVVALTPGPSSPVASGPGPFTVTHVSASWTTDAMPGQPLTITSRVPAGALLFQALGAPGSLLTTPLGTLGIDVLLPYAFFAGVVVGATGEWTGQVTVPPAVSLGSAFTTQALYLDTVLGLGLPCTFVVH